MTKDLHDAPQEKARRCPTCAQPWPMPLVGDAPGPFVRYVTGVDDGSPLKTVDAWLTHRDWDVTDPEARLTAAVEELGPIDGRNNIYAQWFINADQNTAALLIYDVTRFTALKST